MQIERSLLFVPGHRPDRFDKAAGAGADAIVIDLEDAVAPAEKAAARSALTRWLRPHHRVYVRINPAATEWFKEDCAAARLPGVDGVLLPKTEGVEDVVYKQLARRDALTQGAPQKEFTDGEGFEYLGRSYRLRLVPQSDAAVKLVGGRFVMPKTLAGAGREHLIRWYCERAKPSLTEKVVEYAARMEVAPSAVRVQDLGYRWGSCGKRDVLCFHWKTILLPARIAEYVVVHEMAHLLEPHHTPEFWKTVERAMPDFERRRDSVRAHGAQVEGL